MAKNIRVLHAEDRPDDSELLSLELTKNGFLPKLVRVESAKLFERELSNNEWDIVIADYVMPSFSAMEALEIFKTKDLDISFIVVSGTIGEEIAVEAMRAGAHDYIMKDDLHRLIPAIERELKNNDSRRLKRNAEIATQKSKREYQELVENINDIIFSIDSNGVIRFISSVVKEQLGWEPGSIIGNHFSEFIHPADRDEIQKAFKKVLNNDKNPSEYRVLSKSGQTEWVRSSSRPVYNQGKLTGIQGIITLITEEKAAKLALEDSEEQYRTLVNSIQEGIGIVDANEKFVFVNPAASKIFGYPLEKLIGMKVTDLIEKSETAKLFEQITNRKKGIKERYELQITRADNSRRTLLVTANPVLKNGIYSGAFGIFLDITDIKEYESQLQTEKAKLETILFSSAAVIYTSYPHKNHIIEYISDNVLQMTGYAKEQIIGSENFWEERIHPKDIENVLSHQQQSTTGTISYEYRFKCDNGEYIWLSHEIRKLNGLNEQNIQYINYCQNITHQKLAELALIDSEKKYRDVVEKSGIAILIDDPEGNIVYSNLRFKEIFEFEESDLENLKISDIVHEDDKTRILGFHKNRILGHVTPSRYEFKAVTKTGKILNLELDTTIINESGEITGTLSYIWDKTEKKKLEEQYYQAQKMEAVGRLAGGVAHDFNNLLTIISGYSEMLLSETEKADQLYYKLEQISSASRKAESLTKQLLAFSRRQVISTQKINLNKSIAQLTSMLKRLIGEDIKIEMELADDLLPVMSDSAQIEQIILNLAINARDAMPQGGKLTIKTKNEITSEFSVGENGDEKLKKYAVLEISDTGTGMDKQTMERIFEPFFTTKEEGKGTGLGLSMIYGVVKQYKGEIKVNSKMGFGTSFKIYLPESSEEKIIKTPQKVKVNTKGQETILIAEDDDQVRNLIVKTISKNGYKIIDCASAEDAIKKLKSLNSVDLLITDIVLPGVSGNILAAKAKEVFDQIKIIFISGYTEDVISRYGVSSNQAQILNKPFKQDELMTKIRYILDQ